MSISHVTEYTKCKLCSTNMFELEGGEKCYMICKQTASKNEEGRTVFLLTKVGFRFCEKCWEAVSGSQYII
jgi:hypothetical protein